MFNTYIPTLLETKKEKESKQVVLQTSCLAYECKTLYAKIWSIRLGKQTNVQLWISQLDLLKK